MFVSYLTANKDLESILKYLLKNRKQFIGGIFLESFLKVFLRYLNSSAKIGINVWIFSETPDSLVKSSWKKTPLQLFWRSLQQFYEQFFEDFKTGLTLIRLGFFRVVLTWRVVILLPPPRPPFSISRRTNLISI